MIDKKVNNFNKIDAPILLSIGIPTYNRCSYLKSALNSLVHQVQKFGNQVELIVSDNCSEDDTKEVIEEYRKYCPIVYHKNEFNEGAARNVQKIGSKLSNGLFTWIIGDDDLVRKDALEKILNIIEKHEEVDFIFVNASPKSSVEYKSKIKDGIALSDDFPDLKPTKSKLDEDKLLDSFDELIDPDIDEVFLGSLMCGVFKTKVWREYNIEFTLSNDLFDSLEGSYPHTFIYANTMVGRKAYYLSYPVVIPFWGAQEWMEGLDILMLIRLQELLDLYLSKGVNKERIDRCRYVLLENSIQFLESMLHNDNHIGLKYFSFNKFYEQNKVNLPLFENILLTQIAKFESLNIQTLLSEEAKKIFQKITTEIYNGDLSKQHISNLKFLTEINYKSWQKAYDNGYNSSMGNHINYFYNTYISEIGFYNELEDAKKIIEYAPGDASFMQVFIEMFPDKEFNLLDISEKNLLKIKTKLKDYSNVNYFLNYPEVEELEYIDVVFSFLLCQSMPKTLWISHLEKVFNMLNVGGAYFFQFAYHQDGFANDSIDVAISGGHKYTPEEIGKELEKIGYSGCDFTIPIQLKEFNTDVIWYLCKAYK